MNTNIILNDVTIAFSGYNIKDMAVLAIESFLMLNPNMRKRIMYFDDESTDGTREELEKRGIRVITWIPEIREQYENFKIKHNTGNLGIRVSFINHCILSQVNTTYLYLSDGDMIFFQNIFMDMVRKMLVRKATVVGYLRGCYIATSENEHIRKDYIKEIYDLGLLFVERENGSMSFFADRIYLNQVLMDIKTLKDNGIYLDNLEIITPFDDTGLAFYKLVLGKNIRFLQMDDSIEFEDLKNPFFLHFRWASSMLREPNNENRKLLGHREAIIENEKVRKICSKIGLKPEEIIKNYNQQKAIGAFS
jgi:glycosyltransferase involved in cell wall biosynthesis